MVTLFATQMGDTPNPPAYLAAIEDDDSSATCSDPANSSTRSNVAQGGEGRHRLFPTPPNRRRLSVGALGANVGALGANVGALGANVGANVVNVGANVVNAGANVVNAGANVAAVATDAIAAFKGEEITEMEEAMAKVTSKWLIDPRTSSRVGYWDAITSVSIQPPPPPPRPIHPRCPYC